MSGEECVWISWDWVQQRVGLVAGLTYVQSAPYIPSPYHFFSMNVSPGAALQKATWPRGEWERALEGRAVGELDRSPSTTPY